MAKIYIGKGLEEYLSNLQNLENETGDVIGKAVYNGAAIVADAIKSGIDDIPTRTAKSNDGLYADQRRGLKESFGIAQMQDDNGYWNVKLGFDGYNQHKTPKWPDGQPNAMIARSINSGTSFSKKIPFVDNAVRATKAAAEDEMKQTVDDAIYRITKEGSFET